MLPEAGGPSHWNSIYAMAVCQEAVYKCVGMDKTHKADVALIPTRWKLRVCLIAQQNCYFFFPLYHERLVKHNFAINNAVIFK